MSETLTRVPGTIVFDATVYVDNVVGAICVRLGGSRVYFSNSMIVGVSVGETLYCHIPDRRNPSIHKRIKEAMHNRPGIKQVLQTTPFELREKAGDAILLMATKLIDKRLQGEPK